MAASPKRPNYVTLISRVKRNPYVRLLAQGLEQPGLGLSASVLDHFSLKWMWRHRRDVDVIHIHWLELLIAYPEWWHSAKRLLSVGLGLLVARASGVRIVYTMHNVGHHEGERSGFVALGNRLVMTVADCVHVHDVSAAETVSNAWGRTRRVHVIPHPSYLGAYTNKITRTQARSQLSLPEDRFAYLSLGRIRPYKGLEQLILAFRDLDGTDVALIIAGEPHEPQYADQVHAVADGDARVTLRLEHVADDELQVLFNACDVCVLPYQHVTTSGAALLSFSFGTPIVAPRMGCFPELVGEDERGTLYEPDQPDALRQALEQCRDQDWGPVRSACTSYAERLSWESISRQHAAMYATCERGASR